MKKFLVLFFVVSMISCKDDDGPSGPDTISSVSLASSKVFGGSNEDRSNGIAKTADGGVVVVGYTASTDDDVLSNNGNTDFWVLKLDASGNKQWAKSFGGSSDESAFAVTTTADGGYAVVGSTASTNGDVTDNHGLDDLWMVKLDASGNKQWAKTFGGSDDDEAKAIIATSDGGYVISGYTFSTDGDVTDNHGEADVWVLKLNSNGVIQWSKTFGGSSYDESYSMIATANGGFAIIGTTESTDGDVTSNHGDIDVWMLKLDASGMKQWSKTYGGSDRDEASSIITTIDGGYAIAGMTASTDGDVSGTITEGDDDAWIVKLDAAGTVAWTNAFGGSSIDRAISLVTTSDEQYIVSGYTMSTDGDVTGNHGGTDGFILALDASGNELLAKTFGGSTADRMEAITITTDGKYIVTGSTDSEDGDISGGHGNYDFWVTQLDFQ
jgi:hypothetical protein